MHHKKFFLLPLFFLLIPAAVHAALVNINTATETELEAITGVGSTIAGRIIDYRNANGPFTAVTQLQQISGIGSGKTYEKIAAQVTVGDTSALDDTTTASSSTPATSAASAQTYTPPPSALTVSLTGATSTMLGVPVSFSARVYATHGALDTNAEIFWSFGDGSTNTGTQVQKTYQYAGTYPVVVTARDGDVEAHATLQLTARAATVAITQISGEGVTLKNAATNTLDLSGWRLVVGIRTFRIPQGMELLPSASVLVPFTVMHLPIAYNATLFSPDGTAVATYPQSAPQPVPVPARSNQMQEVEVISNQSESPRSQDVEPVLAPAATTSLAAAGAAFGLENAATGTPQAQKQPAKSLLHSPWLWGLGGVVALAGGAFILL